METVSRALGWANYLLTWAWLIWLGASTVVVGVLIARDEWRFHRRRQSRRTSAHVPISLGGLLASCLRIVRNATQALLISAQSAPPVRFLYGRAKPRT